MMASTQALRTLIPRPMARRAALLSAALLAWLPATTSATPAGTPDAAAPVQATLVMHGVDAIDVSYRLPPACKALAFVNDGLRAQAAVHVRSDWTPLDDCTTIDFQSIRPARAACTTLRLRVPATARARDTRVYGQVEPWAQPVGDGLYAHTSAYAVQGCGKVDWRFEAPGGTVMVDGATAPDALARRADDAGANVHAHALAEAHPGRAGLAALLLATPYRADAPPFHADDRVPAATRALLADTFAAALGGLRALLPALAPAPAYALALPDDSPALRADVANGTVLRLLVPVHEPHALPARARALLAHEVAHLAQPRGWPAPSGEDAGALREGGAEFLRLALALRLGWIDAAAARDELEAAVNGCAAAAGARPWRAIDGRGHGALSRQCGLALHALALDRAARAPALERLQALYRAPAAGIDAAARALECGADGACTPTLAARLRGATPLRTLLEDEARRPGALLGAAPAWGPALSATMAVRHLELLVRTDCHGRAGVFPDPAAPRLGPGLRCGVLRDGMVPETAEGLPLFAGHAAVAASARACRTRGSTVLGLRGGAAVVVPCGRTRGLDVRVFGVDPARVGALLGVPARAAQPATSTLPGGAR
ncbi:hypothetical protein [uncultured Massilia sp.]|uniref:hypothetical protein n=1 Tax=uncultured Massilia sp. TaxID=169973 RepID=UPI0025D5522D|nr:hypothetical protein [uncultured Massilia sp.]